LICQGDYICVMPEKCTLNSYSIMRMQALILALISCSLTNGQSDQPELTARKVNAVRTVQRIMTDGLLNEEAWLQANVAGDFIMYNPYNGIASKYRTEVRVLYDDEALYIGAMMYDDSPDSIFTELGARDDDNINSDNFYVEISPFNDGLNGELIQGDSLRRADRQ